MFKNVLGSKQVPVDNKKNISGLKRKERKKVNVYVRVGCFVGPI